MTTLSSLVVPEVVVMATYRVRSDAKKGRHDMSWFAVVSYYDASGDFVMHTFYHILSLKAPALVLYDLLMT